MISFTGSTRAGKRIGELAMQRVARVTLELGGKSPMVILDDADLEEAVTYGVQDCFANSGQTCNALTRMLVPRESSAEVAAIARRVADGVIVGDPLAPGTDLGPLVSQVQQDKVLGYIRRGIEDGATVVAGGADVPGGAGAGYFVRPTVFSDVSNDMAIAREEIFGPGPRDHPLRRRGRRDPRSPTTATTDSGLASGRRARSGRSELPAASGSAASASTAPKVRTRRRSAATSSPASGREMGRFGLEEYLEIKALVV